MEIKLNSVDKLRLTTGFKRKLFSDIDCGEFESSIGFSFLVSQAYFEVRKKDGQIKCFLFESKRNKKEINLGYWDDAEVIFANNEVKF